jgi:hypothetical protein
LQAIIFTGNLIVKIGNVFFHYHLLDNMIGTSVFNLYYVFD